MFRWKDWKTVFRLCITFWKAPILLICLENRFPIQSSTRCSKEMNGKPFSIQVFYTNVPKKWMENRFPIQSSTRNERKTVFHSSLQIDCSKEMNGKPFSDPVFNKNVPKNRLENRFPNMFYHLTPLHYKPKNKLPALLGHSSNA